MTQKLLLTGLLFLTLGCGKETEADKISDAQACLDTATAATAAECVSKVDGLESEGAYLIRCVGKFVEEGYNDSSKISAALASQTGGSDGSTAMMAALAFSTAADSQEAFGYCTKANSEGLIFLSGIVQMATTVAEIAGSLAGLTGPQLEAAMTAAASDPVAQAAVGQAVVGMYASNCSGEDSASGDYCHQFEVAVAAAGGISNTAAIGEQIMLCYGDPTLPACTGFDN